ncbi:hypothetical protein EON67_01630, partial [archaeon]
MTRRSLIGSSRSAPSCACVSTPHKLWLLLAFVLLCLTAVTIYTRPQRKRGSLKPSGAWARYAHQPVGEADAHGQQGGGEEVKEDSTAQVAAASEDACAPYAHDWRVSIDAWLQKWRAHGTRLNSTQWKELVTRGWPIITVPLVLKAGVLKVPRTHSAANQILSLAQMLEQAMDAANPRWDAQGLTPLPRRTIAFLITADDWPEALKRDHAQPVPMLSSCTTPDAWDIPVPHSSLALQDARALVSRLVCV